MVGGLLVLLACELPVLCGVGELTLEFGFLILCGAQFGTEGLEVDDFWDFVAEESFASFGDLSVLGLQLFLLLSNCDVACGEHVGSVLERLASGGEVGFGAVASHFDGLVLWLEGFDEGVLLGDADCLGIDERLEPLVDIIDIVFLLSQVDDLTNTWCCLEPSVELSDL